MILFSTSISGSWKKKINWKLSRNKIRIIFIEITFLLVVLCGSRRRFEQRQPELFEFILFDLLSPLSSARAAEDETIIGEVGNYRMMPLATRSRLRATAAWRESEMSLRVKADTSKWGCTGCLYTRCLEVPSFILVTLVSFYFRQSRLLKIDSIEFTNVL